MPCRSLKSRRAPFQPNSGIRPAPSSTRALSRALMSFTVFNLGIRYDLYTQPVDARDRGSLFDLETGRFALPGKDGFSRAIVDGDHNNLGPRLGFTYQFASKLVVRTGY